MGSSPDFFHRCTEQAKHTGCTAQTKKQQQHENETQQQQQPVLNG